MPALSITGIDRLIEPAPSQSPSSSTSAPTVVVDSSTSAFAFYPPLYRTPAQQRPPSPSTSSQSPYVLNFKRRWVPPRQSETHQKQAIPPVACEGSSDVFEMDDERRENQAPMSNIDRSDANRETFDISCTSRFIPSSPAPTEDVEFFDARDSGLSDYTSEDESSVSSKSFKSRSRSLCSMTARIQEEISRRTKAEKHVIDLQRRLSSIEKLYSDNGISVEEKEAEVDEVRELLVARLVASAVSRATVRAEKDEELENVIAAKNREISRLWDKLQYLELINREMSQRNQEVTELAQRRRKRRQRRQKWFMGIFCASLCAGTVGLACYKFLPWESMFNQSDVSISDQVKE